MSKTTRRGFTLVELMVVMAIIAVLSVLSISALININSNNTLDRAAEEIVGLIRESQNKAISVANDPISPANPAPLAWGLTINPDTNTVQGFYLEAKTKKTATYGTNYTYQTLDRISFTGSSSDKNYFFTSPFGKFYSSSSLPAVASSWVTNLQRPYDVVPSGITSNLNTIHLSYRNSTKTITIATNGDVHAE